MDLFSDQRLDLLKIEMQLIQGIFNKYDDMIVKNRNWFITLWTATIGLGITARVPAYILMGSLLAGLYWFLEGMIRHQYWYKYVVRYRAIRDELHSDQPSFKNLSPYDLTHHYGKNKPDKLTRVWQSFAKGEPTFLYSVLASIAFGVWYLIVTGAIALPSPALPSPIAASPQSSFQYGAVINAGSNGSRLAIFKWRIPDSGIPEVQQVAFVRDDTDLPGKPQCPLTNLNDDPKGPGPTCECLIALTKRAREKLDPSLNITGDLRVPLWVKATAGVRGRNSQIKAEILASTNQCLAHVSGYQVNPAEIISGPEEGLYAWLAVNYYTQTLQTNVVDETHGIVELGGQSAQLAYRISEPQPITKSEHGEIFEVPLGRSSLHIYSVSDFLGRDLALDERRKNPPSYCDNDKDPEKCVNGRIKPFLDNHKFPGRTSPGHLLELKVPAKMHFASLANFGRVITNMGLEGNSLQDVLERAKKICGRELIGLTLRQTSRMEAFKNAPDGIKGDVCFDSFYTTQLAKDGWGLQLNSISSLKSDPPDWPLGAMIYKAAKSMN